MHRDSVLCIAGNQKQTIEIVNHLREAGFTSDDVSVLLSDNRSRNFVYEKHTKAPEGAIGGASTGGILGVTLGWLAGVGSLAIPGVGPLIAAGPIMAALSAMAIGATVGGLTGALIGLGIPEYEAKLYEGKLKEGNTLIAVETPDEEKREMVKEIFKKSQASHIALSRDVTYSHG